MEGAMLDQYVPLYAGRRANHHQYHFPKGEVWLQLIHTLEATVRRSSYGQQAFATLLYADLSYQWSPADLCFLQRALEKLYETAGQIRMDELASHCCLSLRQFERKFKRLTGVTPKLLARLIRFEILRDALIREFVPCPLGGASHFGYQDQAHLIHEFKFWTNCTPSKFLENVHRRWQLSSRLALHHLSSTVTP